MRKGVFQDESTYGQSVTKVAVSEKLEIRSTPFHSSSQEIEKSRAPSRMGLRKLPCSRSCRDDDHRCPQRSRVLGLAKLFTVTRPSKTAFGKPAIVPLLIQASKRIFHRPNVSLISRSNCFLNTSSNKTPIAVRTKRATNARIAQKA